MIIRYFYYYVPRRFLAQVGERQCRAAVVVRRPAAPPTGRHCHQPRHHHPRQRHRSTVGLCARRSIHPSTAARTCAPLPVARRRRATSPLSCRCWFGPVRSPRAAPRCPADGPFRFRRRYNIILYALAIINYLIITNFIHIKC